MGKQYKEAEGKKMTIGKNSRKSSARSSIRAPKFLDKSSGFYGRLGEPELTGDVEKLIGDGTKEEGGQRSPEGALPPGTNHRDDVEALDLNEGMMDDDGETLLSRKPSRRSSSSSRWRRSSRRKQKDGRAEPDAAKDRTPRLCGEGVTAEVETMNGGGGGGGGGGEQEPTIVHFTVREDADDQVLIRDKKRGREEEGGEERKMKREQEGGVKVVKRNTLKNYRKALDRALRRGWEVFITNIYSVTLTPVTSSASSPSSKEKHEHNSVLAEFQ